MAIATAISTGVLEPIDELIAKLVGGSEEALAAVLKHEDVLRSVSRYHNLDSSTLLGAVLDYQIKFKTLPNWTDLEDFILEQQQNAGVLAEYEAAHKLIEDGYDPCWASLDVLIGHVEESVKGMILRDRLAIANRIAGSGWEDPEDQEEDSGSRRSFRMDRFAGWI